LATERLERAGEQRGTFCRRDILQPEVKIVSVTDEELWPATIDGAPAGESRATGALLQLPARASFGPEFGAEDALPELGVEGFEPLVAFR
jgi:hypothetical protein